MDNIVSEIVKGRKTFFIAPDNMLLSPLFLEDYLAKSYECYFIYKDLNQNIVNKVHTICNLFPDSIIFFNIDYHIETEKIDWFPFIQKISRKYPEVCIGVMFEKRKTLQEKQQIEEKYIYEIGISGGCVQLEYQKSNNFVLIEKVLFANQAMGRRKTVRVICPGNCFVHLESENGKVISKQLNDISLSHFSFTTKNEDEDKININIYDKLFNVTFIVKGYRFVSDIILVSTREIEDGVLYVFAFCRKQSGLIGLDEQITKLMIKKMYEILLDNCNMVITDNYVDEIVDDKTEKLPPKKEEIEFDENQVEEDI